MMWRDRVGVRDAARREKDSQCTGEGSRVPSTSTGGSSVPAACAPMHLCPAPPFLNKVECSLYIDRHYWVKHTAASARRPPSTPRNEPQPRTLSDGPDPQQC
jgi:hypothetical protein